MVGAKLDNFFTLIDAKVCPAFSGNKTFLDSNGKKHFYYSKGINLNILIGDPAFGKKLDHFEPCLALCSGAKKGSKKNARFNLLPLVGDKVYKKGFLNAPPIGVVTGKHGGSFGRVLVDSPPSFLKCVKSGDYFVIKCSQKAHFAKGTGKAINCSKELLDKLSSGSDNLTIKVKKVIPAELIGSGIGSANGVFDVDLISDDTKKIQKMGLENLLLGDIVAIKDFLVSYGATRMTGKITIGVVAHGDSKMPGHGPGITPLACFDSQSLRVKKSAGANIGKIMKLGRFR